jgi:nitroreductase
VEEKIRGDAPPMLRRAFMVKGGEMVEKVDVEEKPPESRETAAPMYVWEEGMDWNPVERVILERRSNRKFKDKQVPEALVRRILEMGRFAPSAGNSQPWRFKVIRDRKMIESMEKAAQSWAKLFMFLLNWRTSPLGRLAWLYSQIGIRFMRNDLHPIPLGALQAMADGTLKLFQGAQTVILIYEDKRGAGKPELDCGICGQNMVLAAHSLGLGTCWIGLLDILKYSPRWRRKLEMSSFPYRLVEGIVVGYPVGHPDGMIERELQEVEWYEDGQWKTVL